MAETLRSQSRGLRFDPWSGKIGIASCRESLFIKNELEKKKQIEINVLSLFNFALPNVHNLFIAHRNLLIMLLHF